MKGMNLSSFKKVAEDKHSATMMHKDGHKMVIAAALPAIQRKQLEKLPVYMDGGDIESSDDSMDQPMVPQDQAAQQDTPVDVAQPTMDRSPASSKAPKMAAPENPMSTQQSSYQKEKAANLEQAKAQGTLDLMSLGPLINTK